MPIYIYVCVCVSTPYSNPSDYLQIHVGWICCLEVPCQVLCGSWDMYQDKHIYICTDVRTYITYITAHRIALHCLALPCIALHCVAMLYLHTYIYTYLLPRYQSWKGITHPLHTFNPRAALLYIPRKSHKDSPPNVRNSSNQNSHLFNQILDSTNALLCPHESVDFHLYIWYPSLIPMCDMFTCTQWIVSPIILSIRLPFNKFTGQTRCLMGKLNILFNRPDYKWQTGQPHALLPARLFSKRFAIYGFDKRKPWHRKTIIACRFRH